MGRKNKDDYMREQQEAEAARVNAKKLLESRGVSVIGNKIEVGGPSSLTHRDNTLELVRKRKAQAVEHSISSTQIPLGLWTSKGKEKGSSSSSSLVTVPDGWAIVDFPHETSFSACFHKSSGCMTFAMPKENGNDLSKSKGYDLPVGWKALLDPVTNHIYFWHPSTNQIQWEQPCNKQQTELQQQTEIEKAQNQTTEPDEKQTQEQDNTAASMGITAPSAVKVEPGTALQVKSFSLLKKKKTKNSNNKNKSN